MPYEVDSKIVSAFEMRAANDGRYLGGLYNERCAEAVRLAMEKVYGESVEKVDTPLPIWAIPPAGPIDHDQQTIDAWVRRCTGEDDQ